MPLVGTRELIADAIAQDSGLPGFNAITLEQAEFIVEAAEAAGKAVLLQVSQNAIRSRGAHQPMLAACRELAQNATAPVGIHIDHVDDERLAEEIIRDAARLGIGSLMFDASTLPYDANVEATARIVDRAHAVGLIVEGELGEVAGKRSAHAVGARTDRDEAIDFVARTGVDLLAVAVGSVHAMTIRSGHVDSDLIAAIAASVDIPLVLHGSSGLSDSEIRGALAAGIRKVNIGTALNVVATHELRASLTVHPDVVDPRIYSRRVKERVMELVEHYCRLISHRTSLRSAGLTDGVSA